MDNQLGAYRLFELKFCSYQHTNLAIGTIFNASALLMQNPAPPVANQKRTFFYHKREKTLVQTLQKGSQVCFVFRGHQRLNRSAYLGVSVLYFKRLLYAWLSQIPIVERIVATQQLQQPRNVYVVVVVTMAKPFLIAGNKGVEFDAHLAAQRLAVKADRRAIK